MHAAWAYNGVMGCRISCVVGVMTVLVVAGCGRGTPEPKALGRYGWQVQPTMIVPSGDGVQMLSGPGTAPNHGHLASKTWAPERATATGTLWIDNCRPYCATGTYRPYAATVVLSRAVRGRFTRLTYTYTANGHTSVERWHVWRGDQYR